MPRKALGARLYCERNGVWYIRDLVGGSECRVSTRARDRREAEKALARYIADKDRPQGPSRPDEITAADVLALYGSERAPTVADPERIAYAIRALVPILGALPVASLNGAACRRYAKRRGLSDGTIRKELGTLQAALNYAAVEGLLTSAPRIWLPPKPAPRDRWLTRDEVAALLRAAYRNPKAKHLARFILTAIYTGTRSQAILGLRYTPHTSGGNVDTEDGMLYRRAPGKTETKKRTPPVPIPARLLAHLRRWERMGAQHVVEIDGMPVASVKRAWATALATAGIDHCTRHDLRRTAVTWAMRAGADKWAASGFFGLSFDMLERVYGHHHPDYLRSAVEAMGRRDVDNRVTTRLSEARRVAAN